MENDFREEFDAKLDATQSRIERKLMEHKVETREIIDALRHELSEQKADMKVGFAQIDNRLERGFSSIIRWLAGLFAGAMISFVTVITFVLNHAS